MISWLCWLAPEPSATVDEPTREIGVTEVLFGLPDKTEDEVAAYVERLAGKLADMA